MVYTDSELVVLFVPVGYRLVNVGETTEIVVRTIWKGNKTHQVGGHGVKAGCGNIAARKMLAQAGGLVRVNGTRQANPPALPIGRRETLRFRKLPAALGW